MTDAEHIDAGTVETRAEATEGGAAETVRFWTMQLALWDKQEEAWRKRAAKVLALYADVERYKDSETEKARSVKFNILYSNVQTLAPALLPSIPTPDVRRRFRDEDPVGRAAADMLERCASTLCDQADYDFGHILEMAVLDRCLPGRSIVRVEYEPGFDEDEAGEAKSIAYQTVRSRQVQWDDFRRGPGKCWDEIRQIAFRHKMTRDQLKMAFPDIGAKVELDQAPDEKDVPQGVDPTIYKRCEVWEIWDKDKKQIVWIAKSHKDRPLKTEADPLRLQGFWPIPRPLYAVPRPDSLDPVDEFRLYEDQARELDKVTQRIDKIVSGLKVRGIAAAQIKEFEKVARADDNTMVVAEGGDAMAALQQGGMDKLVWMWPIETAIAVLKELYVQREAIKQTIYEIIGLGDIMRGTVDPREKLGQSQIKASTGARRMDAARKEVERFARDLIRLKIELIAEHFEPEQLMMMSGIKLPTQAEKQQAQQMAQMAQQQGAQPGQPPQPMPPQLQEMMSTPTIEEVMAVIKSDAMRTFRVDVESDQTITGDENAERELMVKFLDGTANYWTAMGPVVQGGFPVKVALGLYNAAARRFHLGRDVEDELAGLQDEPPPPPPQPAAEGEDPSKMAAIEVDKQRLEVEKAEKLAQHQRETKAQGDEVALKNRELDIKERELDLKTRQQDAAEMGLMDDAQFKREELADTKEARQVEVQQTEADRDAEMQRAEADRQAQGEMKSAELESKASLAVAKPVPRGAKAPRPAMNTPLNQMTKIMERMEKQDAQRAEEFRMLMQALTAPKRGKKLSDGSIVVQTDMGRMN